MNSSASSSQKERVLIVSAHPLFRDGIIHLLGDEVEVVGTVSTWEEARSLDPHRRPQVIIVDHDDADLKEADLAPLLWPDAEDLRVIYVTLAGDRMTIHDRRQVVGAGEADLLQALKSQRREPAVPPQAPIPGASGPGVPDPQGRVDRMDKSKNRRHLIIASVLVGIVAVIVAFLLLNMQMFQPAASTQAGPIDQLFNAMLVIIAFLFALIVVFMIYSVIVFRRRPGEDGDGAHIHGNTRLEIVWTILPLITVLVLGTFGARGLAQVTAVQDNELEVEVVGQRYAWQFNYPDQGVKPAINEAVVPLNQPLLFKVTSIDVIHDFWVPEFRVKQDAVPGLIRELRITPTELGEFVVRCDELCGILHHAMLATIRVVEQSEFDAWVAELQAEEAARAEAAAQLGEAAARGAELSVTTGCTACHNISGEPGGVGPTWLDLFGSEREFVDGSTAVVDEEYIRSSILNPNDQVVAGYVQGLMPQTYGDTLSDEQINDLVEYIKSLGGE